MMHTCCSRVALNAQLEEAESRLENLRKREAELVKSGEDKLLERLRREIETLEMEIRELKAELHLLGDVVHAVLPHPSRTTEDDAAQRSLESSPWRDQ